MSEVAKKKGSGAKKAPEGKTEKKQAESKPLEWYKEQLQAIGAEEKELAKAHEGALKDLKKRRAELKRTFKRDKPAFNLAREVTEMIGIGADKDKPNGKSNGVKHGPRPGGSAEKVLNFLRSATSAQKVSAIAEALELKGQVVQSALKTLAGSGLVVKAEYGHWLAAPVAPPEPLAAPSAEATA